jgi:transposase InsO family protein
MCSVLRVSRSGYYAWLCRKPSARAQRRSTLTEEIRRVHARSRAIYGSPRVHGALRAEAIRCSKNTVAKLMRGAGLRSKRHKRFRVRTTDSRHPHPIAPNRLNREFCRSQPNEAWGADVTYIRTGEGWLYLAVVIDLCSRKIVGWSTSDSLAADLCVGAWRRLSRSVGLSSLPCIIVIGACNTLAKPIKGYSRSTAYSRA